MTLSYNALLVNQSKENNLSPFPGIYLQVQEVMETNYLGGKISARVGGKRSLCILGGVPRGDMNWGISEYKPTIQVDLKFKGVKQSTLDPEGRRERDL